MWLERDEVMKNLCFIGAQNFLESDIFKKFSKFPENEKNESSLQVRIGWIKGGFVKHSTSPPCGNLVDGLPHDCHR